MSKKYNICLDVGGTKVLGAVFDEKDQIVYRLKKDAERTAFLEQYDLKVIRITNREIRENFRGVCEYIDQEIRSRL